MGEDGGRYFLSQMCNVLEYMHGKGVVHRDLKLENILVDEGLNLKVADFGFATFKKIHSLSSYRGTMTYMAPEIKEGKKYDGIQIDMFSVAVILFIIVQGIFPFKEARKDEYFYKLIIEGQLDTYWTKTGGQNLSPEFKDLIIQMFAYDGSKRPTIDQIRAHPWMTKDFDLKKTRDDILAEVQDKRSEMTDVSSRQDAVSRGDKKLDLVKQSSFIVDNRFNDMTDFDITVDPGVIWDDLNTFNEESYDGKFEITHVENKHILLLLKAEEQGQQDLKIKVKFFQIPNEHGRYRIKFVRKSGELDRWYSIFCEMKDGNLSDVLARTQAAELVSQ